MAIRRSAWVLNLDADLELASPAGYAPRKSVLAAMGPHVELLRRALLRSDDLLVTSATQPNAARGLVGRAFCPTPRALGMLERAGASAEPHPPVEILAQVNSRAFAASLGRTLPNAEFVTDVAAAISRVESDPEIGDAWRIKRAFGMAGRGQRVIGRGTPSEDELSFVRAGLREGGVQIEPNVRITGEYAMHAILEPDGALHVGKLVSQRCDRQGAWLSTELADDPQLQSRLAEEVQSVARALGKKGYFGPFGIDAYLYRDRDGNTVLQPRSEINARYSMGFAVGLKTD